MTRKMQLRNNNNSRIITDMSKEMSVDVDVDKSTANLIILLCFYMRIKKLFHMDSVIAIILSFVGGILDIYCLFNFDFYATMHTGNIIKMVENFVDGNYIDFLYTVLFILFFIIGLFIANALDKRLISFGHRGFLNVSLLFFVIILLIPNDKEPGEMSILKLISACICGFLGALLIHSFTRFGRYSYSSTAMTSNMNRAVSNVYERITKKDKSLNYGIGVYAFIFLFFVLGVASGYVFMKLVPFPDTKFWNLYSNNLILIVPIFLITSLLVVISNKDKIRQIDSDEENTREE